MKDEENCSLSSYFSPGTATFLNVRQMTQNTINQ